MSGEPHENQIASSSIPIGYCPNCNYELLSAGICPECGRHVAIDRIRSRPRWLLVRQWARRAAVATLLLTVISAGVWFYATGQIYRLYPDSTLLGRFPANFRESAEIRRRIAANQYSNQELQALFVGSLAFEVIADPPVQGDGKIKFRINATTRTGSVAALSGIPELQNRICKIDGKVHELWRGSFSGFQNTHWVGLNLQQNTHMQMICDTLPSPGDHQLDVVLLLDVSTQDPQVDRAIPYTSRVQIPFRLTHSFHIDG